MSAFSLGELLIQCFKRENWDCDKEDDSGTDIPWLLVLLRDYVLPAEPTGRLRKKLAKYLDDIKVKSEEEDSEDLAALVNYTRHILSLPNP